MKELDRVTVKTEVYDFAHSKLQQYGEDGVDLAVISFLEVSTELGVNVYGFDETLNLLHDLQASLIKMRRKTQN